MWEAMQIEMRSGRVNIIAVVAVMERHTSSLIP